MDDLELEMIDFGADEFDQDEEGIVIYGAFESFNTIQKALEEGGYEILSADFERIPNDTKELNDEQAAQVMKLIEKIEVFNAEKIDGVWEQRLRIHYNCVGTIEIPTVLPLPIPEVSVNTRKGVVVNYAPCELAV